MFAYLQPAAKVDPDYAAGYVSAQIFMLTAVIFIAAISVRAAVRQSRNGPRPLRVGMPVLVQWADGNRYPAAVEQTGYGQYLVAFPDGRRIWVARAYVTVAKSA